MTVTEFIDRVLADNERLLDLAFANPDEDPYTVCSCMLEVMSDPDAPLSRRVQLRIIIDVILQASLTNVTRETFRKQLTGAMRTRLERLHSNPKVARELQR